VFSPFSFQKGFFQVFPQKQNIPYLTTIHTMSIICDVQQIGLDTRTTRFVLAFQALDRLFSMATTYSTLHFISFLLHFLNDIVGDPQFQFLF